jgi:hypothetical protein
MAGVVTGRRVSCLNGSSETICRCLEVNADQ